MNQDEKKVDGANSYIIDAENAAEMARLIIQDRMITQAMGGPLAEQEDVMIFSNVLDIACGPGGWLLDLVKQYPHLRGVGIDISELMTDYATHLAQQQNLSGATFQAMDATQPLQFADGTFDLVNGRTLTGFLTIQGWSSLLQDSWRLLRKGGIIRLTEPEFGFTNSAALEELTALAAQALHLAGHTFSPRGRNFGTTPVLRSLQLRAGFHDVKIRAHVVDYSSGTELHQSNVQNLLMVYALLQPFLVQMQVATEQHILVLYEQVKYDLQQPDFCGIDYYLTAWGKK